MAVQQLVGANVAMTTATNEYSIAIPPGAINLQLKCRDLVNAIKVYTVSVGNGGSPANFYTINPNSTLSFFSKAGGQTLYLMSTASAIVLEASYLIDL